jgi:helicase
MKVEELPLPADFISFLRENGIKELYPPQEAAVKAGLLDGRSLVISSPTACYDEKTEVLTRTGWKFFRDTSPNEEVLSMNPRTFEMEYVKAESKTEYFYRGTMVHVKGKEIDFRVTENHNMFVGHNHKPMKNDSSNHQSTNRSCLSYQFLPAREINHNWKFKTDGTWKGRRKEYLELPTMNVRGRYPPSKRPLPVMRIPMRDFLNFFGWYIAEGSTKFGNGNYEITLCQKKEPVRVRDALARLGLAEVYTSGSERHRHFSISCPQLARYLAQFGKAFEKSVPDFIKELPPDDIMIFLESYSRGDGHLGRDGVSLIFNTTSKRLADDIHELLLKVCISSSVRFKGVPVPHVMPDGHTIIPKHPNYQVAGRRRSEHGIDYRKPSKPSFEATSGEQVYCLTLPKYHLLYVRRNGKAIWCGNSGKTLIAMMAAFKKIKEGGRKVVYLTPLRALASEKYSEFRQLERFGVRCAIGTGDFDASGEVLGKFDFLVLTNEKFDSILRHGVSWLPAVGLYVSDEVHLAGSGDRGPTLEMILTKVIHLGLDAQLISLSATISNAGQLAEWLKSDLVSIDWRPVPLKEGVYDYGRVVFYPDEEVPIVRSSYGAPVDVAIDSIRAGGQSLIFAGTRRRAVSLATKGSEVTTRFLGERDRQLCREAATKIRESGEETGLSKLLAENVERGAAFHHAGLSYEHRRIVEDYYRMRAIKLLSSTPTLAAGVNLPARRVVVADLSRYDVQSGMNAMISILEYRQMAGRAGRPQYDEFGETVIVPPTTYRPEEILEHFVRTPPEPIESKLGGEKGMRVHLLAAIAGSLGSSRLDIDALFSKTLLAAQIGKERVSRHIDAALGFLLAEQLVVQKGGLFQATGFGKRISTLYIDPLTGVLFKKNIGTIGSAEDQTIALLYLAARSPDFEPKFPVKEKQSDAAYEFLETHRASLVSKVDSDSFLEYDEILADMRTVMVINAWIEELREDAILDKLGVEPGDLHRAVESAEWLLYCMAELARLFGRLEIIKEIEFLRKRVRSGIKSELVPLTSLDGVGRVRARSLYSSGFKTLRSLKEASVESLAQVDKIGPAIARKIKEQT